MSTLDHEKLDVYQVAIDFVGLANDVVEALPSGRSYLARQLQRASTSIPLNIAEGAGEYSQKDKARFYRIALRSGTECAAILDVCQRLKIIRTAHHKRARDLVVRIVSMLTKMAKRVERSGTGAGAGTGTRRSAKPGQ